MKHKRSKIKAYRRKWRRLPKKDRIFVLKFLGAAFSIFILLIILIVFLIFRIIHQPASHSPIEKNVSTISVSEKETDTLPTENSSYSTLKTLNQKKRKEQKRAARQRKIEEFKKRVADEQQSEEKKKEEEALALRNNPDVQLLARLITAETGSSSKQAQIAVASVVINRVNSDSYPSSISEVIYQRGQYSPTWNGSINNTPSEMAIETAIDIYQNGSKIPKNVLFQAMYPQGSGVWAHIDGNYFCYK